MADALRPRTSWLAARRVSGRGAPPGGPPAGGAAPAPDAAAERSDAGLAEAEGTTPTPQLSRSSRAASISPLAAVAADLALHGPAESPEHLLTSGLDEIPGAGWRAGDWVVLRRIAASGGSSAGGGRAVLERAPSLAAAAAAADALFSDGALRRDALLFRLPEIMREAAGAAGLAEGVGIGGGGGASAAAPAAAAGASPMTPVSIHISLASAIAVAAGFVARRGGAGAGAGAPPRVELRRLAGGDAQAARLFSLSHVEYDIRDQ
jgi:hypothetical protein